MRQRHLIDDLQAVAFERDDFARMIRQHANPPQSQIDQDLRADAAFVLHQALAPEVLIDFAARVINDARQSPASASRGASI